MFTFAVQVCDDAPRPLCATATVTATITPVAHPDAAATTVRDVPVTFTLTRNDLGGVGTPTLTGGPANGTATIEADGQATYTPNAGFTGDDSFQYMVCATAEPTLCTTGTATVFVDPAPLPPVTIEPAALTTTATVPVVADLTFNHAAADLTFTVSSAPAHGTASVDASGRVTYSPTGAFTGRDQFTVRACSVPEPTNCGTALITVTVLPVAGDDTAVVQTGSSIDIPVKANDVGAVGPPQNLSDPAHGTASVVTTSIRYTPDDGFVGADSFTYTICSTADLDVCATATVDVTVTAPPNLPPTAQDTSVTGPADAPVSGQVIVSDPDAGQQLTVTLRTPPASGTAVDATGPSRSPHPRTPPTCSPSPCGSATTAPARCATQRPSPPPSPPSRTRTPPGRVRASR